MVRRAHHERETLDTRPDYPHAKRRRLSYARSNATFIGSLVLASVAAAWLAAGSLAAQAAKPAAKAPAKPWTAPRTPDGKPDLSGFYDVATMTPVERPAGVDRLVLTPQEALALEKYEYERQVKNDAPISGDRAAPPVGGENTTPKSYLEFLEKFGGGAVGGYNNFWLAGGMTVIRVDGQSAQLAGDRSAGRQGAADEARGDEEKRRVRRPRRGEPGRRRRRGGRRACRRVRRPRAAAAGRAVPPRFRIDVGSAHAAELLLQQHEADRADEGHRADPERDGPRRPRHPHERGAPAVEHPQVDGRFGRQVGRRHAGRRHDQLHQQDPVPRLGRKPARRRALHAHRAEDHPLPVHGRRSDRRGTGRGPASIRGTRPSENLYEYACHEGNYSLGGMLRGARQKEAEDAAKKSPQ